MTWVGPNNAEEVRVPDLVGLTVPAARKIAWESGVVITSADRDGPPLGALTWPGVWIITAQRPAPGTLVRRLEWVVVDFRKQGPGEDDGDREPRNPHPPLDALSAELDVDKDAGPTR